MSKHRHVMKKKEGGSVIPNKGEMDKDKKPLNAGGDIDVEEEAEEEGEKKPRKHGGAVGGHAAKHRMDRPIRKAGGRVGSDKAPFSESSSVKPMTSAGKC